MTKRVFSGTCLCGHNHMSHHGSLVVAANPADGEFRKPGECLAFGSNELGGMDRDGETVHCDRYVDRRDPDEAWRLAWVGTRYNPLLVKLKSWCRRLKWYLRMSTRLFAGRR